MLLIEKAAAPDGAQTAFIHTRNQTDAGFIPLSHTALQREVLSAFVRIRTRLRQPLPDDLEMNLVFAGGSVEEALAQMPGEWRVTA